MFNIDSLWSERSTKTSKELGRYLRYIFNGHLMIVMIFLLGSLAFYYQEWLKTLNEQFPAAIIMSVFLSILLTYSPIYSFLLEADQVFLLPIENKLTKYFWQSGMVSFILQAYIILMVLAAFMPMYVQVYESTFKEFFFFLIVLLLLKSWNLALKWRIQYFVEKNVHITDSFVRYSLNTAFTYLLFVSANKLLLVVLTVVMLTMFLFFYKSSLKKGLKWEEIILLDQNRMNGFYRIANLFTDVPKLKEVVKRRMWLDWIARKILFHQDNTQFYLLVRTFLRSGDYLGLVVRLTIIGSLLIFYWDFVYGQFIFIVLFMYLTGFQLMPLKNHHQNVIWIDLYPNSDIQKEKAFRKVISFVLYIQGVLFGVVFLMKAEWMLAIAAIGIAIAFTLLFVRYYSLKKV